MPSPFPGMDPYLEDERLWPAFHSHLIQSFNQLLAPGLMDRYVSRIAERRYGEEQETYVEVRSAADDRLITVLDLISPANKAEGLGRQAYLDRRKQSLAAKASLVEIDLLLQGRPLQDYAREGLPDWDYAVTVTRSVQPDRYEIYTGMFEKRLPRFRMPLAADDRDTVLDLQAAVARTYEMGGFGEQIDYLRGPPVDLTPDQRQRINHVLEPLRRAAGVFPHDEIAAIAYRLWEDDGRPDGRDQEHWHEAIAELKRMSGHSAINKAAGS
jgi:hypothetical protein